MKQATQISQPREHIKPSHKLTVTNVNCKATAVRTKRKLKLIFQSSSQSQPHLHRFDILILKNQIKMKIATTTTTTTTATSNNNKNTHSNKPNSDDSSIVADGLEETSKSSSDNEEDDYDDDDDEGYDQFDITRNDQSIPAPRGLSDSCRSSSNGSKTSSSLVLEVAPRNGRLGSQDPLFQGVCLYDGAMTTEQVQQYGSKTILGGGFSSGVGNEEFTTATKSLSSSSSSSWTSMFRLFSTNTSH
jgi:hypothetical protein